MVIKDLDKKAAEFFKKYRYVALVLLIGLVLMVIPGKSSDTAEQPQTIVESSQELTVAQELAQILSKVDGAGNVEVFLTVAAGEETFYQTDEETSTSSDSGSTSTTTVTVTNAQKDEYGLVRQTNPPVYKGAIIVCQGADDPQIRLAIVNAISNATGLGADRISVLKMK